MSAGTATRAGRGVLDWYVPTGRIRRSELWLSYVLVLVAIFLLAQVADSVWFSSSSLGLTRSDDRDLMDLLWVTPEQGGPLTLLAVLLLAVPNVAALVCRLHDRGHSAWWLAWNLLPGIGTLVLFVTAGLLGTDPRPNRYGPPPG